MVDPNSMKDFTKAQWANLNYGFNWERWLDGDTLSAVTWVVTPPGLTTSGESNTTTTATVKLAGGEVGRTYEARCRITTASGNTNSKYFRIIVID